MNDYTTDLPIQIRKSLMLSNDGHVEMNEMLRADPQSDKALEAWTLYLRQFGEGPESFIRLAQSLRTAGRRADAEEVLTHAMKLFPDNLQTALVHADMALQAEDWEEASFRYANIREVFPEEIPFVHGGWALWAAGRFDEADVVLSAAIEKFPSSPWAAIHYAWSALHRKNWDEAARRFADVRAKFPDQSVGYIQGGWALREAGQTKEAEEVLREAVEKFPDDQWGWFHYARNASASALWHAAVERLYDFKRRLPDSPLWPLELKKAQYDVEFHFSDVTDVANGLNQSVEQHSESFGEGRHLSPSDVLTLFESLGDNCDFGLTQRHFGAEPLGLLRFGNVPDLQYLLDALNTEFEGVGLPENTSVEIGFMGEFLLKSTKGFAIMHSGIYGTADTNIEKVLRQMCPRLQYLARRLTETLTTASKIWVYKQFDRISDKEIQILYDALRRYGANKLLCIRLCDADRREGEVDLYNEDVAVGYMQYEKYTLIETPPRVDVWLSICQSALARLGGPAGSRLEVDRVRTISANMGVSTSDIRRFG